MAGYEQLTPDQLMLIMYLIVLCVLVYSFSLLIRDILRHRSMKMLKVEIHQLTNDGKKQPSLFTSIMKWYKERKEKKEKENMNKPFG